MERVARHAGPIYATTVFVSCVLVVALAVAGTPTH
jgi:hypothetical protein